ncbi:MAG: hypothetical protein KGI50_07140 [Patescibacteria group bacterium]|nr:hypothetical protein [Patescibacteria group bacterium]MDE2439145.1 hypothetical protein [Patescibacteria group bacterium]
MASTKALNRELAKLKEQLASLNETPTEQNPDVKVIDPGMVARTLVTIEMGYNDGRPSHNFKSVPVVYTAQHARELIQRALDTQHTKYDYYKLVRATPEQAALWQGGASKNQTLLQKEEEREVKRQNKRDKPIHSDPVNFPRIEDPGKDVLPDSMLATCEFGFSGCPNKGSDVERKAGFWRGVLAEAKAKGRMKYGWYRLVPVENSNEETNMADMIDSEEVEVETEEETKEKGAKKMKKSAKKAVGKTVKALVKEKVKAKKAPGEFHLRQGTARAKIHALLTTAGKKGLTLAEIEKKVGAKDMVQIRNLSRRAEAAKAFKIVVSNDRAVLVSLK